MAVAIERAKRLKLPLPIPEDSISVCTFGDASVNHAVASTAFKSSQWSAFQHLPVPVLFVCEDNGIGISVWTPKRWVENHFSNQPDLTYFRANGLDLVDAYNKTAEAVEFCRSRRTPVFLHMETVRLLGHAGSDVETEYLSSSQIEAFEAIDPLIHSAKILLESGVAKSSELLEIYDAARERVEKAGEKASRRPRLESAKKIMEALAPYHPAAVEKESKRAIRKKGDTVPDKKPRHLAVLINRALQEMMIKYPEMLIFGEDVAKKGGVYHVTTGLQKQFGVGRVFNTLLDETTILGLAIGAAHIGFLPVPEIQYLAYYHNAEDQIRGEAGSLQFFSNAQFRNPMVIRMASFGYQKGFGGHFHNDNSIAALRDVPGVVIAAPSRGDDAVQMFRTAMALAKIDGRVVFFLEPIALYMMKDLYEDGDGAWSFDYPESSSSIPIGEPRIYRENSKDLTIVTYANGVHMSLRAAKTLEKKYKLKARVIDLRWLQPLPLRRFEERRQRRAACWL